MISFSKRLVRAAQKKSKSLKLSFCTESFAHGENSIYAEQMYQKWIADRDSVHASWDAYFTNISNGLTGADAFTGVPKGGFSMTQTTAPSTVDSKLDRTLAKEVLLTKLIQIYRKRGHEIADIYPIVSPGVKLEFPDKFITVEEDPERYGFTKEDLHIPIPYKSDWTGFHNEKLIWTPAEVSQRLLQIYSGKISFEYLHLSSHEIQSWFRHNIERYPHFTMTKEERQELFHRVCESDTFTKFCIKKFPSSKRFGIDGCDAAISGLEKLVDHSKTYGVRNVVIGMAHRGRLNTLACVFDVPYHKLFTEFYDPGLEKTSGKLIDAVWGFSGDVKYHLGSSNNRFYDDGAKISISMPPNPSHLEMVDPVVIGKARAKMDFLKDPKGDLVCPVVIHGDAAMSGQGIVYETVQMEGLKSYSVGGTIHAVFNNNIGFTTNPKDSRTSRYCTDVAKTTNRPIIHVNADDPEYVDWAFKVAVDFRNQFKRDIYVDVCGYRQFGHNEQDMPAFTQPQVYDIISKKKPMYEIYRERLIAEGVYTEEEVLEVEQKYNRILDEAFEKAKNGEPAPHGLIDSSSWDSEMLAPQMNELTKDITSSPKSTILEINERINTLPKGKKIHRIISRVYKSRYDSFVEGKEIDWASAEMMAYGTLLREGFSLRIAGEDVERGTFSHRHAIVYDQETQAPFNTLLQCLDDSLHDRVTIGNSLLSEYAALGFEYGYSISSPFALNIWEGQFGDFANVGQPIIDQMIVSGEAKWGQRSGLTLLLPHGYDGQGPEHSSARLERFLQLVDDNPWDEKFNPDDEVRHQYKTNIAVCNITSPANYFHVLRRQMKRKYRKPLVVMSPKKLLRHKLARSTIEEFDDGTEFNPIYAETFPEEITEPSKVRRILVCSGQVYFDLLEHRRENNIKVDSNVIIGRSNIQT